MSVRKRRTQTLVTISRATEDRVARTVRQGIMGCADARAMMHRAGRYCALHVARRDQIHILVWAKLLHAWEGQIQSRWLRIDSSHLCGIQYAVSLAWSLRGQYRNWRVSGDTRAPLVVQGQLEEYKRHDRNRIEVLDQKQTQMPMETW